MVQYLNGVQILLRHSDAYCTHLLSVIYCEPKVHRALAIVNEKRLAGLSVAIKVWPVPMYGALSPHDQLKAFRPATRGTRKVS